MLLETCRPRSLPAAVYRSFEGEREFITEGRKYKHPASEAAAAIRHMEELRPDFDELLILRFMATNLEPYPFEWVNAGATRQDYGAFLVRIFIIFHDCGHGSFFKSRRANDLLGFIAGILVAFALEYLA